MVFRVPINLHFFRKYKLSLFCVLSSSDLNLDEIKSTIAFLQTQIDGPHVDVESNDANADMNKLEQGVYQNADEFSWETKTTCATKNGKTC